jgi:VIT1/CCC1 family predicted Fe2+/Mn2+ transporter
MIKFGRLSVRALMCVTILAMASMLLTYAATALIEAQSQARHAGRAVT